MKNALRFAAALALPVALGFAGVAAADPMAADHPMSASPMAASPMAATPMATTPMATDSMAAGAKAKPKMKHHAKKAPATGGAMGADAMASPTTGAMGH